jgi:hypothetical protein
MTRRSTESHDTSAMLRVKLQALFTEPWPIDHDPGWPPAWCDGPGRRPLFVYLDQWCYDHLARDRAGRPHDATEAGTFKRLRDFAMDGSAVFLLSEIHYRETWVRENANARWDSAVAMGELTGFQTIRISGLERWENHHAVARLVGTIPEPPRPSVIGHGLFHCIRGGGAPRIIDTRTGLPPRLDDLSEEAQAGFDALERRAANRFELGMLARRDPSLEIFGLPTFGPVGDEAGQRFVENERKIKDHISAHAFSKDETRQYLYFLSFRDSIDSLFHVASDVGVGDTFGAWLSECSALEMLDALPIQGLFTELRLQALLKADWQPKASDVFDFLALATVAPFVDIVVTDRRTSNLFTEAAPRHKGSAAVLHRVRDVCGAIETAAAAS